MNQPIIKYLPASLTTGIGIGSRVLLPELQSSGVVVAIGCHEDGAARVFAVKLAGEELPILVPRNEAMRAPPGALFLSPGGDDIAPFTPSFPSRGGVA
jgi:hypothetical protein